MGQFCGWAGMILSVDLTTGKVEKKPLSQTFAKKYLGASGFNSARLFELVKPKVDALSPENILMFGAGPLSGTLAPGSSRLTVTTKSPLTDIFGDSNMGGSFAPELKYAGYDQIVIFGKSKQPVYLWVDDDKVELRNASHLWGRSTWDTASAIRKELDDFEIKVVCIGQAGENLVRMANIMSPPKRAAGRTGMGAVMGSKNLKAIAVRGSKGIAVAKPEEFLQICSEMRKAIREGPNYHLFHDLGTPGIMEINAPTGDLGVRNFQRNVFPNWEALSGERLRRDFTMAMRACFSCPVGCSPFYSVRSGEFAGLYGEGPEYAITELSLQWDCDNLPPLLKIGELFNQYGIDDYSAGNLIAWAMDCYERGILTNEDFEGTPLRFGDPYAVIEMIPKIAKREGFGNVIAEGEKRAPKIVGRGSEKFMYHVKGLAPWAEDPRANKNRGLGYYTSTRGACGVKALPFSMTHFLSESDIGKKLRKDPAILNGHNPKGAGMVIKWCEDAAAVVNASGVCIFSGGERIQLLARVLSSATGVDLSVKELLKIGERIYNIQKAFNSRQGLTRRDDDFSVPEKFTQEPIKEGSHKGNVLERDMMLDDYYEARGWDLETGLQAREKLEELGLERIIKELKKANAVR